MRPQFPSRPTELRAELAGALTRATIVDRADALIGLAARRPHRLVLDMRAVTFLDAHVVRRMLALERRLTPLGGQLVIRAGAAAAATLFAVGAGHLLEG
jgi:anti-anti-sigma regulatory factor